MATQRIDFADLPICYQPTAQALAGLAGFEAAILIGAPGTAKTMLARRVVGLLAPITDEQAATVREVYSRLGMDVMSATVHAAPFRAPHYTISQAALRGLPARAQLLGGLDGKREVISPRPARPGEVELATHGVLFLDELTEFAMASLETIASMRKALGDKAPYLIASANPCPCGFRASGIRECACSERAITAHEARLTKATRTLGIVVRLRVEAATLEMMKTSPRCMSSEALRLEAGNKRFGDAVGEFRSKMGEL